MNVDIYLIVSSIALLSLFVIWTRKDWFNLSIKVFLLLVSIWGGFEAIISLGYVVAV